MEGNRIRELRIKRGISLNKLSKDTRISKSYLSFLERDIKSNPSLVILKRIADTLKVDIDFLIEPSSSYSEGKKQNEKGLLKLQIELSEEEMDQEKYERIKELIDYFKEK